MSAINRGFFLSAVVVGGAGRGRRVPLPAERVQRVRQRRPGRAGARRQPAHLRPRRGRHRDRAGGRDPGAHRLLHRDHPQAGPRDRQERAHRSRDGRAGRHLGRAGVGRLQRACSSVARSTRPSCSAAARRCWRCSRSPWPAPACSPRSASSSRWTPSGRSVTTPRASPRCRATYARGRADPHRARCGRQHHQGDHQGHRHRDRGTGGDGAVRLLPGGGRRRARRRRLLAVDRAPQPALRPDHRGGGGVPVQRAGDQRGVPCRGAGGLRGPGAVPHPARDHGLQREAGLRRRGRHLHPRLAPRARDAGSAGRAVTAGRGLPAGLRPARRLPRRGDRGRGAHGGVPRQRRRRLGQRQEARRGGGARRQGLARPRGDDHRRHGRRPVQGHRRPGAEPAAQGDEPGGPADRADRRALRGQRRRREHPAPAHGRARRPRRHRRGSDRQQPALGRRLGRRRRGRAGPRGDPRTG